MKSYKQNKKQAQNKSNIQPSIANVKTQFIRNNSSKILICSYFKYFKSWYNWIIQTCCFCLLEKHLKYLWTQIIIVYILYIAILCVYVYTHLYILSKLYVYLYTYYICIIYIWSLNNMNLNSLGPFIYRLFSTINATILHVWLVPHGCGNADTEG